MELSITQKLYDLLHKKRIATAVARRMGVNEATLLAQLRMHNPYAKLDADALIPLFQAIRDVGYGRELRGVVKRFIRQLEGTQQATIGTARDFAPQLLELYRCLGILSGPASKVSEVDSVEELMRLKNVLEYEILSGVHSMLDTIEQRLAQIRGNKGDSSAA